MNAIDLVRQIEHLHRQQQRVIVEMIADPDDNAARRRYRQSNAQILALRWQLAAVKEQREVRL